MTIPEKVPSELVVGDTWRWTREWADYPASTWAVTFYFDSPLGTFSQLATASGTTHSVTIASATTAGFKPGRYRWVARGVSGGVTETIESGWLEVLANVAAGNKADHRTWARRALDAVKATIEGRASSDQQAMSIAGRSISRMTYVELRQMQTDLEAQVRTEEQGSAAGIGRNIRVRFGRA